MLLASHAEVAEGRLFLAGGSWSIIGPQPVPFAVALVLELPWNRSAAPVEYSLLLRLVSLESDPVLVQAPTGEELTLLDRSVTVGPGRTGPAHRLRFPVAVNSPALPLPPGDYEWRLWIDQETEPGWSAGFVVVGEG